MEIALEVLGARNFHAIVVGANFLKTTLTPVGN